MSRTKPVLTIEQYRERTRQLRVEVANVMWSLVVSPAPADHERRWRSLTPDETQDVFDRLLSAIGRHSVTDSARVITAAPVSPRAR